MRLQSIALFCIRNPYQLQHFHSSFFRLIPGYFLIFDNSLCDLFANRDRRIQRQHRILEHHAYLTSAQLFHFFSFIGCDILSAETDLSAFYMCIRWQKLHHTTAHNGFSTSGLTYDTKYLSFFYREINIPDGLYLAVRCVKAYRIVF